MGNATSAEEQIAIILAYDSEIRGYHDLFYISFIRFSQDVNDEKKLADYTYLDQIFKEPIIVEEWSKAYRAILESRYIEELEAYFEERMQKIHGFRPKLNCHDALKKLNKHIEKDKTSYIVDADIKGFFNNMEHERIMELIKFRITDPNILYILLRNFGSYTASNIRLSADCTSI